MITTSSTEQEIRTIMDERFAALSAQDAEAVLALGIADPVQYTLAPPLTTPNEIEGFREWLTNWAELSYETRDLEITAGEEVAFCHALVRMSGRKHGQDPFGMWFRQTTGFRKIDGSWKITHEHESVPFAMDGSFLACVDLEP
ncbi:YybH family protein [Sciscionella sediminilitoris]|uniref:YybH family protein n=1 Tax=Sciscionella sediminilitoris TaxID=1445613 RepID=UPI0004DEECF0|nr:nuclear transport factor 2 family protein [Sciscionella sp. SE31]